MRAFDASALIHGWDHYPIAQFPVVWEWLAEQFRSNLLSICDVAFQEVQKRSPDCGQWLNANSVEPTEITENMVMFAFEIKQLLEIEEDRFHPNGVGENDLLIISAAHTSGAELISNEGRQNDPPKNKAKYKIPVTCAMESVDVPCIAFIDLIKGSGVVFGQKA